MGKGEATSIIYSEMTNAFKDNIGCQKPQNKQQRSENVLF